MRIDRLVLQNFKKFAAETFEFPRPANAPPGAGSFHVLIGENGTGKTTILDALAVALGVWLEWKPDSLLANSHRRLKKEDKRLIGSAQGDRTQFQRVQETMSVRATGAILDREQFAWGQELAVGKTKVSNAASKQALDLIKSAYERVGQGANVLLPVICYYGAGRAWLAHNERNKAKAKPNGPANRWEAFYDCLNERIRVADLAHWFLREHIEMGNRNGRPRPGFEVVRRAVLDCVPGADGIRYDSDSEEIALSINGNSQPFGNLSAGQRVMLALVADLAIKIVTQNNFLVPADKLGPEDEPLPRILAQTPGVVLIDELDVHLHPKWQRGVVESLRNVFPAIQFITTTHSPFIVQSLREDELINLQGQTVPQLGNLSVEQIANGLMGVDRPDVGQRYEEMVAAAKDYLVTLDEATHAPSDKIAEFEDKLADRIAPYADNPAFQAFLELKHAAKLGAKSANASATQQGGA
ncbi:MAG: AAA family ATPase [Planctomycetes bacterium]|nr:AAA family ATPase [Planctomycetota bacterium]